jgi:hypothetical protein
MAEPLRCTCGYRVRPRDVIEGGAALDHDASGKVYLKFVCGHCERIVPLWLSLEEWDDGRVLQDSHTPQEDDEQDLGIITHAEVRRFREALNGSTDCILALRTTLEPRRRRGRKQERRGDQPQNSRES